MPYEDPQIATRSINILAYFTIGSLAVLIWDILSELQRDIQQMHSVEFRPAQKISYILSRITMLAYIFTDAISQTTPIESCTQIHRAMIVLGMIAIPTTALIIFFRIRAVFQRDRFITVIFGVLWLSVVGGSATIITGVSLESTPSKYCTISQKIAPYYAGSLIGPLLYLCLGYMFISAKLVSAAQMDFSMQLGFREFFIGEFVPVFSKGLLQEGQVFYLSAVIFQLITFIIFISTPTPTRFVLVDPSLALMNIMACKVYRNSTSKEERRKIQKLDLPIPLTYVQSDLLLTGHQSYNLRGIQVTKTVERNSSL
ncbi:hypothetical protein GALMADRAFT_747969 [Galerina marginata CBS 339.88]|uniref:Glucose receptor Git3 N-terminal domain-containing protein n=1 Tax=Galerina marginata (strain CBS 339.88) TaxID=685588 RepID=A0A067SQB7_GALM3|nr:hypothetical protein GALMADRAFT_747969 [Galerina marginata CBS 339.88]